MVLCPWTDEVVMPENSLVVFVTASSKEEAETIASAMVEERLAACANILPSVTSIFRWEGKVERESEVLIVFKTRRGVFEQLKNRIKELHSYEVPEIIALPIVQGSDAYLRWLKDETETLPRAVPKDRRGPFGPGF
jgi:periplasmic divalent cation tolerance protein